MQEQASGCKPEESAEVVAGISLSVLQLLCRTTGYGGSNSASNRRWLSRNAKKKTGYIVQRPSVEADGELYLQQSLNTT